MGTPYNSGEVARATSASRPRSGNYADREFLEPDGTDFDDLAAAGDLTPKSVTTGAVSSGTTVCLTAIYEWYKHYA